MTSAPGTGVRRPWLRLMAWGQALWFVATLGVLGFLAGWQVDRGRGQIAGRVALASFGVIAGALLGRRFLRR